jgi:hypothetical protein
VKSGEHADSSACSLHYRYRLENLETPQSDEAAGWVCLDFFQQLRHSTLFW